MEPRPNPNRDLPRMPGLRRASRRWVRSDRKPISFVAGVTGPCVGPTDDQRHLLLGGPIVLRRPVKRRRPPRPILDDLVGYGQVEDVHGLYFLPLDLIGEAAQESWQIGGAVVAGVRQGEPQT